MKSTKVEVRLYGRTLATLLRCNIEDRVKDEIVLDNTLHHFPDHSKLFIEDHAGFRYARVFPNRDTYAFRFKQL